MDCRLLSRLVVKLNPFIEARQRQVPLSGSVNIAKLLVRWFDSRALSLRCAACIRQGGSRVPCKNLLMTFRTSVKQHLACRTDVIDAFTCARQLRTCETSETRNEHADAHSRRGRMEDPIPRSPIAILRRVLLADVTARIITWFLADPHGRGWAPIEGDHWFYGQQKKLLFNRSNRQLTHHRGNISDSGKHNPENVAAD
jgi:hypothetical protein